jgi:hypothetical protein
MLGNDFDPEGDMQTISLVPVSLPTNGTVSINPATQQYVYTPDPDFTGTDQFTYEVCDNGSPVACDTATVYITVFPDNNPPDPVNDINGTLMNLAVSGSILTNDKEPDGDNMVVNTTPVTNPSNGTVTLRPDGTYTYTPDPGFAGTDKFEYVICDDVVAPLGPLCDTATVVIEVRATVGPIPPVANPDEGRTLVNVPVSGSLVNNDGDLDGGTISVNTVPVSGTSNGTVVINPDGTYEYTPNPGYVGTDKFQYEICDNSLPPLCDTALVTLTVMPEDDLMLNDPPFAGDDASFTAQDVAVGGNLFPNDTDPNGDNISVNTSPITPPANGILTINPDGSYIYTPNPGYTGPDQFVYEICDDGSPVLCTQATVYILVVPASVFPVEWLEFNAVMVDRDGLLEWATASEQNSDHFRVQRSTDGQNFQNIGRVEAAGNSGSIKSYGFIDEGVSDLGAHSVFYRLKEVDINGAFQYSKVIELTIPETIAIRVLAYPNPVSDFVTLEIHNHDGMGIEISLFDARGAEVRSDFVQPKEQVERIGMDMRSLVEGVYYYRIVIEENTFSGKLVKER